jgi:hypothetical protein
MYKKLIVIFYLTISHCSIFAQSIIIGPSPVYFGKIPIGSDQVQEITVLNLTPSSVNISSITIVGETADRYIIINNPAPYSLNAYAQILLTIKYTPLESIEENAVLRLETSSGTLESTLIAYGTEIISDLPTFERILGYEEKIETFSLAQTPDKGFIIVGTTKQRFNINDDIYLLKTDRYGKEEWNRIFEVGKNAGSEDEYDDEARDVLILSDGSILVLGDSENRLYLSKWTLEGEIIWEKFYGNPYSDSPSKFIQDSKGNLLVVGGTTNTTDNSKNVLLLKIDPGSGDLLWRKDYGSSDVEEGFDIAESSDGGYVIIGNYQQQNDPNIYAVKVDNSGNLAWDKIYQASSKRGVKTILLTSDNGYITCGYTLTQDKGMQGFLLKLDSDGEVAWEKNFGENHVDFFSSVVQTEDGGFLCVGSKNQFFSSEYVYDDIWLVKTSYQGDFIWEKKFGGELNEKGTDIIKTENKGYAFLGETESFTPKSKIYFFQTNSEGSVTGLKNSFADIIPVDFVLFQNYPNPFNPLTTIKFVIPTSTGSKSHTTNVKLNIFDILGNEVALLLDNTLSEGIYQVQFNAQHLATGIYFYQLKVGTVKQTKKMILIK